MGHVGRNLAHVGFLRGHVAWGQNLNSSIIPTYSNSLARIDDPWGTPTGSYDLLGDYGGVGAYYNLDVWVRLRSLFCFNIPTGHTYTGARLLVLVGAPFGGAQSYNVYVNPSLSAYPPAAPYESDFNNMSTGEEIAANEDGSVPGTYSFNVPSSYIVAGSTIAISICSVQELAGVTPVPAGNNYWEIRIEAGTLTVQEA
jgi:hypothetical protein